jgi:hypothetical protein
MTADPDLDPVYLRAEINALCRQELELTEQAESLSRIPQKPRRAPLDAVNDLSHAENGISFDKHVNVIGHNLKRMHDHAQFTCYSLDDLLQSRFDRIDKHCAPILRTPDNLILEAGNCPGVAPIPIHARQYMPGE